MNVAEQVIARKQFLAGSPARKFFVDETKSPAYDPVAHTATFVISDATVDRDFDVLFPDGVDLTDYVKNPIVLYQHDSYSDKMPIGQAIRTWVEAGQVKSTVLFDQYDPNTKVGNKLAMEAESCVASGSLRATSVGFISKIAEPDPERVNRWGGPGLNVKKWLLLEWSIVKIPSNPNCVIDRKALDAYLETPMSGTKGTNPDASPMTGEGIAALHKALTESISKMEDMHAKLSKQIDAMPDAKSYADHSKAVAVHAGLVEDQKALCKSHKSHADALEGHIGNLAKCIKDIGSMGVGDAVAGTQVSYQGPVGEKLLAAEKALEAAKTTDERLTAAAEVADLRKQMAKDAAALHPDHRALVHKAMKACDRTKAHLAAMIKAADESDTDAADPDDDEDQDDDSDSDKAAKKVRREAKAAAAKAWREDLEKRAAAKDPAAVKELAEFHALLKTMTDDAVAKATGKTNF